MFGGYNALTPAEEAAWKKEREAFTPLWEQWHEEFLNGARKGGIPRELADDPRTLYQLSKLLQTARACEIPLDDARKALIPDLLEQLKRTGVPPPVQ